MKILKFGGTSVGSPANIKSVMQIVEDAQEDGERVVVVVSAFGGVTDRLIEMGKLAATGDNRYHELLDSLEQRHLEAVKALVEEGELRTCIISNVKESLKKLFDVFHGIYLLKELSLKTMDLLVSFGELLSAYIIAEAFKDSGVDAEFLDTRDLLKTDESFGCGKVYFERSYQNIQEFFTENKRLQIATGFIASTFNNETTTFGRGGSDFTAALFGRALEVSAIEIWTDVDGVMTADPRKVGRAFPINAMTYEEAMEMSHFGAKVLHPPTMHPAVEKNIPIIIKNTFNPLANGTVISRQALMNGHPIRGVSSIDEVTLLRIQGPGMLGIAGVSMRIFGALARRGISIILITQASSEHSICIAVEPTSARDAQREIEDEFSLEIYAHQVDEVIVEKDLSIIAVVGERMRHSPGIAGRIFSALGRNLINVIAIAQGSSELNVSFITKKSEEVKALNVIHDAFFEPDLRPVNIFLTGTGLIGSTLLEQIKDQSESLKENHQVDMRIVGLADSKRMAFDDTGIDLIGWRERLNYSPQRMDIDKFIRRMKDLNLRNSIFVDCTASASISEQYVRIMQTGFSIVTPNKMANTSNYSTWLELKKAAISCSVRYLYETNVGAALPIINTLHGLLYSGDEILRIESILSGSLSYVFNSISESRSFSEVFSEAIDKGFTEPDPRIDVNGVDVARKILILARECGCKMELGDVKLEKIVDESVLMSPEIPEFLEKLTTLDAAFEEKRKKAESNGKVLRYVSTYEDGKAEVSIMEVGEEHPFYSLSFTDNIVAFKTKRYFERPLVIRGPGAGGDVTAGGVFADIMSLCNEGRESKPCL
ncbi:MAG: aspartokinase/homoserine dehydrogenase 1 [Chlamydiales bacterium]|jgi:aspartokinase/homoserine dehydrogenase 1